MKQLVQSSKSTNLSHPQQKVKQLGKNSHKSSKLFTPASLTCLIHSNRPNNLKRTLKSQVVYSIKSYLSTATCQTTQKEFSEFQQLEYSSKSNSTHLHNKLQNSKRILTTLANLFTAASLTSLLAEPIEVQFVTSNFPASNVGALVLIFCCC